MFAMFTSFLANLGTLAAQTGSVASPNWWIEEPECPESLVK